LGRKKMESHFQNPPDKDYDHERGSGPAQDTQSSDTEYGRDHHQDAADERENWEGNMHAEIELDCPGKKGRLDTKPADKRESDGKGNQDGP